MNDELRMFRSTVRKFIQKEFAPHQARWRQQHRPDAEAWPGAGAIGILLPDVPQEYGGGGGTFAHEAVVREELAVCTARLIAKNLIVHDAAPPLRILSYGGEIDAEAVRLHGDVAGSVTGVGRFTAA